MNITIVFPQKQSDIEELNQRVTKFHAECVRRKLEQIACPVEQKQQFIEAATADYTKRAGNPSKS